MWVSAILLGAGRARRMGRDNLSLPWGRETILQHCLLTLLRSRVEEIILVVSNRTGKSWDLLGENRVKVVFNDDPRKGMSQSIRCGIQSLNPRSEGILIALGDQPFLKVNTVNALLDAFREKKEKIIIPCYKGERGHPVIFPIRYREELLSLEGDEGGRAILERHAEAIHVVRVRSEGVIRDIDTWEDYRESLESSRGTTRKRT